MSDSEEKKNVTTVSWNQETTARFDAALVKAGYKGRAHFFELAGMAFIEQIEAGQKLEHPPIFVLRSQTEKTLRPRKANKPQRKRPIRKKKT